MQKFDVNKLRVASPCSVGWETMTGDERVRHCHACRLNIYNIVEMTTDEVQHLIENREELPCIRMFRRHDGTVITKDCPVGLRAYKKQAARFAGAALAGVLGLFSVSYGQKDEKKVLDKFNVEITRIKREGETKNASIIGTVTDIRGAVIPDAKIKLTGEDDYVRTIKTDSIGEFAFTDLPPGTYDLEIKVKWTPFKTRKVKGIEVTPEFTSKLTIPLAAEYVETVGVVGSPIEEVTADISPTSITTIIKRRP